MNGLLSLLGILAVTIGLAGMLVLAYKVWEEDR